MPIVIPTPTELKQMSWAQRVELTKTLVEKLDGIADLYDHLNTMLPAYQRKPLIRMPEPFDPELVREQARQICERTGPDPQWVAHQLDLLAYMYEPKTARRVPGGEELSMRRHLKLVA